MNLGFDFMQPAECWHRPVFLCRDFSATAERKAFPPGLQSYNHCPVEVWESRRQQSWAIKKL